MKFPIIGVDFLRHFKLSVNPAAACLVDTASSQSFATVSALAAVPLPPAAALNAGPATCAADAAPKPPITAAGPEHPPLSPEWPVAFLEEFKEVVTPSKVLLPVNSDVEHHIQMTGTPIASKFRRLDPDKLAAAKAEFLQLERDGIVQRSNSPWSSPLHMVRKLDGSWRPCGDFRRLNTVTVPDAYPLPNMMDFAVNAAGCKVFSKIDLRKGYHQIPMHPADLESVFGYLDDLEVASEDEVQHAAHLRQLFLRLREHGLVINLEKCVFGARTIDFLGHRVTAEGVSPLPSHVKAVTDFPRPATVKELQGFLGLINFYRRYIPAAAAILKPLTDSLRGGGTGADRLTWLPEMQAAFEGSKEALAKMTLLSHPLPQAKLSLAVDASATHVGAALQQQRPGSAAWEPLRFFSRKLEPAQVKYSAFDRELLACYLGIRYFRYMVEGRKFTIYTDHKPLTFALKRTTDPWTARQCRQLAFVAEYTSDLRHLAGKDNVVSDALSRPHGHAAGESPPAAAGVKAPPGSPVAARWGDKPISSTSAAVMAVAAAKHAPQAGVDYYKMAAAQKECEESLQLAASPSLQVQRRQVRGVELLCDVSTAVVRPIVPPACRREVFAAMHYLAHPGIRATRRMVTRRFIWKGCGAYVARWCRDCQECQRGKMTRQPTAVVQPIPVSHRRFSHLHVDLVGPLPTSPDGFKYIFTVIDRSTRWLEAIPVKNLEATTAADALVEGWISRFSVPADINSDRGTQLFCIF